MLHLFWILFWLALTALMVVAGVRLHVRRKELSASPLKVDDAAVRAILTRGQLSVDEDEPLDLSDIDEREERFWSDSWDEPEEW